MRALRSLLVGLLVVLPGVGCDDGPRIPLYRAGSGVRVVGELSNTTCLAFEAPRPEDVRAELAVAFGGEAFYQPMELIQHPVDDDRWYVVEKEGYVETFLASDPAGTRALAVDVTDFDAIHTSGERGLLGMAFHPDFATNGEVYLSYVAVTTGAGDSIIARYVSGDGGLTFAPHPTDDVVLQLHQPAANHNGGDLAFGPDGMLYATFGDGGGVGDQYGNGQNLGTMNGSVIRIDVDTRPYAIPADNPFVGAGGAEEIYAYGLRNPWRMSFDQLTGDLWLGDVGQASFEEVDLVVSGGNYGWPLKEAFACYNASPPCDAIPGLIDPVVAHPSSEAHAISGGFVYRGDDIIGLAGAFVYGDHVTGILWALFDGTGSSPLSLRLMSTSLGISGFGQGRDGEIYVLDNTQSPSTSPSAVPRPIQKLVPPPIGGAPGGAGPAALLSETGCVDPDDPFVLAPGVIPYQINAPLWSDGAGKVRGLAIPNGTTIGIDADGDLQLPIGSVLVKHFLLGGQPVETRLFMHHDDDSWAGYSYEWNAAGTDADLLDDGKVVDIGGLPWLYPSPADCFSCHTPEAGFSLGPELAQLERDFDYGASDFAVIAGVANQLDALAALGVFVAPPGPVAPLPELGSGASAGARARAYLHANCSMCHRPGGSGGGAMDLRWQTAWADAGLCDVVPLQGDLGLPNARLVAPGAPESSVLLARMRDTGVARMPPLASTLVDAEAAEVVETWIEELVGCP